MGTIRLWKLLTAGLGGGALLQTGGCDASALATNLVNEVAPIIMDYALEALIGGLGV